MFKEPVYNEDDAMNNMYKLLIGEYENINQALDNIIYKSDDSYIFYPFDPNNYTDKDLNKVLTYFSDRDEFEKCIKLMECCSIKTKN